MAQSQANPPPADATAFSSRRKADSILKTYRYLRISVSALPLVIVISILVATSDGAPHWSSISYYFYSPVRSIFVGALFGVCVGLIAIKGRDKGGEDTLLNLAGILAPIVAVVPTLERTETANCEDDVGSCIRPSLVQFIDNNVQTLFWLALAGVVAAWLLAVVQKQLTKSHRHRVWNIVGLVLATALLVAMVVWYRANHDGFINKAHYIAAAGLFICITVVAIVNAFAVRYRKPPFLPATVYRWAYAAVAVVMVVALSVAAFGAWQSHSGNGDIFDRWLFWCEVVLLGSFTIFWAVQTLDYWDDGVPSDDEEQTVKQELQKVAVKPGPADSARSAAP